MSMLLQRVGGEDELLPWALVDAYNGTYRPSHWSNLRLLKLVNFYNPSVSEQNIYSDQNDNVLEVPLLSK